MKWFPIMNGPDIQWEMIEPHQRQALINHGQSLEHLASRGGLSCCEAVAVLEDRKWSRLSDEVARDKLLVKINNYQIRSDILSGKSCQEERAMGNGGCGLCPLCCRELKDRVEELEIALRALEKRHFLDCIVDPPCGDCTCCNAKRILNKKE